VRLWAGRRFLGRRAPTVGAAPRDAAAVRRVLGVAQNQ